MASFFDLYESSQREVGKDFWFKPPSDDEGKEVIQRGLEIRSDRTDGNSFWDDFIGVFGQNTDEAAKLLGVSRDKVAKWPDKIKRLLDNVRSENDNEGDGKNQMLPTGKK
jgi:hypothetical protein